MGEEGDADRQREKQRGVTQREKKKSDMIKRTEGDSEKLQKKQKKTGATEEKKVIVG